MRMEELSESRYIKGTDTVERYLLDLVRFYFKDNNIADVTSREHIIRKAVLRMKEELRCENIGVLSVTLPDGTPRTGAVTITLNDIGAEPAINPKLSAFNVNFGHEANTACEGNDPRLSDSRDPNPHTHTIQDINGLEGRLSTLLSIINRTSGHTHSNSTVLDKLVYSGNASTIDLNFIDTLEPDITDKLDSIKDQISKIVNTDIPNQIDAIDRKLKDTDDKIKQIQQTTGNTHENYLRQAKAYTDDKIPNILEQFNGSLDGYVTEEQLSSIALGALSYIDSIMLSCSRMSDISPNQPCACFVCEADIPDSIIQEINKRNTTLRDCFTDALIRRDNGAGSYEWTKAPYLYIDNNGNVMGTIIVNVDDGSRKIKATYKSANIPDPNNAGTYQPAVLPDEIKNAVVEVRFYSNSKRSVTTT